MQALAIAEQERQQKDIEEARELARETEARRQAEAARAQEAEQSAAQLRAATGCSARGHRGRARLMIVAVYLWIKSSTEADRADANADAAGTSAARADAAAERADANAATAVAAAATSSSAEALALAEQAETQRQSRLALSRELAARAAQVLPHDTELATLLAAAALSTTYSRRWRLHRRGAGRHGPGAGPAAAAAPVWRPRALCSRRPPSTPPARACSPATPTA